jgi:hypothetical protein
MSFTVLSLAWHFHHNGNRVNFAIALELSPTFVDARVRIVNFEFDEVLFTSLGNWVGMNVLACIAAQNN